jgi:hypothetical protein
MPGDQDSEPSVPAEKPFYRSSNGDRWYLAEDQATGSRVVRHVANPQSGGHVSYQDIESFLSAGQGPEHQAFRLLMKGDHAATILIAYDLHPAEGAAYDALVNAIRASGVWWHHMETAWIVRSDKTPEDLRDQLKVYIGPDDQLLVVDITGARAEWAGVSDSGSKWLEEHIRA